MKAFDSIRARTAILAFAFVTTALPAFAAANLTLWDTMSRDAKIADRGKWKAVPSNLMELEKDPLKASSDPGYYGREYQFNGDVVFENASLIATFSSASGAVTITAKPNKQIAEILPLRGGRIESYELIRNAADEVVLSVSYGKNKSTRFTFGKNEIVEIKPSQSVDGLKIVSSIDYGIVPGFVGDDLIYNAGDAASDSISVPSENMLVGLLTGEDATLVMTWPHGKQQVRLIPAAEKDGSRSFSALEVNTDGQSIFLAARTAPSIWHREKLDSKFLEKDVTIEWKPPFPAKWQTQLSEGAVKTTFAFRSAKGTVWRGVPGMYNYPVWFDGEKANFSLTKKVPPRGEAVVYFLESHDTPASILAPVDILKATLGRPTAESILDVEGRKLRTHHGASGSGVHRACTCGYTEAIQTVFEKGEETDKKAFVDQSIRDMIYFVEQHVARINEYRSFATNLTEYLRSTAKPNPGMKEYLEDLEQTAQQIPAEYENQKENMKSLAYAAELEKQTMALTRVKDPNNLKRYMELLKLWRGMGGAQDYVVAQYHTVTRRLFQDAGYNCAANPKAVEVAQQIRARCKEILRNPDGYEIWPNY